MEIMMGARQRVARELESAANHIDDVPRHELQILLRQAALLLRNLPEPPDEQWLPIKRPVSQGDDPGAA
jgi:hypothetical protein